MMGLHTLPGLRTFRPHPDTWPGRYTSGHPSPAPRTVQKAPSRCRPHLTYTSLKTCFAGSWCHRTCALRPCPCPWRPALLPAPFPQRSGHRPACRGAPPYMYHRPRPCLRPTWPPRMAQRPLYLPPPLPASTASTHLPLPLPLTSLPSTHPPSPQNPRTFRRPPTSRN